MNEDYLKFLNKIKKGIDKLDDSDFDSMDDQLKDHINQVKEKVDEIDTELKNEDSEEHGAS